MRKMLKQFVESTSVDEFAPTMRAEHHGNIEFRRHGEGERRLTVREAALIQTFPPSCLLTKPNKKATGKAYKPIGNAVPPLLGYLVARKVREILESVTAKNIEPPLDGVEADSL